MLRAEQEAGGPTTDIIKSYIAAGKLVPDEIVVRLLKGAMEHTARTSGRRNFLIDGFPRSFANLEAWSADFGREAELPTML
jgi:adenylate kinase family enzyme